MKKILLALISIFAISCSESELISYDTDVSGLNFTTLYGKESYFYHYSFTGVIGTDEIVAEIPVRIMGIKSSIDRSFDTQVLKSTVDKSNYEILDGIVPADSYTGKLRVRIKNRAELRIKTDTLAISIIDNKDFKVGAKEQKIAYLTWNDQLVKFTMWNLLSLYTTKYYSPNLHRALVAATGEEDPKDVVKIISRVYQVQLHNYLKKWKEEHGGEPLRHDANDGAVECMGWEITAESTM